MESNDFLPIQGVDYIEFYVGNAKQSALYYQHCFGYAWVAYAGPETGIRNKVSYVLRQDRVTFVFTSSLVSNSVVAEHVQRHGDGVRVIALRVDDAIYSLDETARRGAEVEESPHVLRDNQGEATVAAIKTYGETIHRFVSRNQYQGIFLPGYEPVKHAIVASPVGLKYIDHCVGNVPLGEMNKWVKFYEDTMGFRLLITFDDKDISTEYSALMSKVVSNGSGYVKFPINEPAQGKRKSQIEEYLDYYKGAGVQHIAITTNDIVETVASLRHRGVDFLHIPDSYYEDALERVGEIEENIADLRKQNILLDRDDEGYLLQIFTQPVQDRPTLFFEIIQRHGATSFGKGNFKALFEAIEREQSKRGNL